MAISDIYRSASASEGHTPNSERRELRKTYLENGYVTVPNMFTRDSLATLLESVRAVLTKSGDSETERALPLEELILRRETQDHSLVYKASQSIGSSAATYQLLGSSGIFDTVSEVTGFSKADLHLMPMYLIIQLPSDERFDYAWHQDGSYYSWCQDFLTLWFPVNRGTRRDTGTISMIPGSHRYGPRETDTFLKHGFFKQIQSKLHPGEADEERVLETELGDCCIMNGNTVHRSVANLSSSPRIAAVLRIAHLNDQELYERDRFYCSHK